MSSQSLAFPFGKHKPDYEGTPSTEQSYSIYSVCSEHEKTLFAGCKDGKVRVFDLGQAPSMYVCIFFWSYDLNYSLEICN